MSQDEKIKELTARFKMLGLTNPEMWAESEVKEGIPQYARAVFLKTAWNTVVPEDNDSWIDGRIKSFEHDPNGPCAGAGRAIRRMLSLGVSREDISDLVRTMQYKVLHGLCYQLSDPGVVEYPSKTLPQIEWALMQLDKSGNPVRPIDLLPESVLSLDPTGREMRPRK
jgi:hypothetical protein